MFWPRHVQQHTDSAIAFNLALNRAVDHNAAARLGGCLELTAAPTKCTTTTAKASVLDCFAVHFCSWAGSSVIACPMLSTEAGGSGVPATPTSPAGSTDSRSARKRERGGNTLRSSPPGAGADMYSPASLGSPALGSEAVSGAGRQPLAISLSGTDAAAAGGAGESDTPRKGEGAKRRRRKPHRPDSLMGAAAMAACVGRSAASSATSDASGSTPVLVPARRTPVGTPGAPPSLMPPPQGAAAYANPVLMVGFTPPAAATKLPAARSNLHRPQGKRADSSTSSAAVTAAHLLEGTAAAPIRPRTDSFAELSTIVAGNRLPSSDERRQASSTPTSAAPALPGGYSPAATAASQRTPASHVSVGRSAQRRRARTASFASLHRAHPGGGVPTESSQRPGSAAGGGSAGTPMPEMLSVDDLRASMPTASPAPRSHSAGAGAAAFAVPRTSPPAHVFGQLAFGRGPAAGKPLRPQALQGSQRSSGGHGMGNSHDEEGVLQDATGLHEGGGDLHEGGDSDQDGRTSDDSDEDSAMARQAASSGVMPQPRSRSSSFAQAQAQRLSMLQGTSAPLSPANGATLRPMPFFPANAQLPVSMAANSSASSSNSVFGSLGARPRPGSSLRAVPLKTAASWESNHEWGGWTHPSSTSAHSKDGAQHTRTQRSNSDLHLVDSDADGEHSDTEQPLAVDALLSTPQLGATQAPGSTCAKHNQGTDVESLLLPLAVPSMDMPDGLELTGGGGSERQGGQDQRQTRSVTSTRPSMQADTTVAAAPVVSVTARVLNQRPSTGQAVAAAAAAAAASRQRASASEGSSTPSEGDADSPRTPSEAPQQQQQRGSALNLGILQSTVGRFMEALAPAFLLQQTMMAVDESDLLPNAPRSMTTDDTAGSSMAVGSSSAGSVDGGASTGRSTAGSDGPQGEEVVVISLAQRIAAAVSALPTWADGVALLESAAEALAGAGILQAQHVNDVRTARSRGDAMVLLKAASVVVQVTESVVALAASDSQGGGEGGLRGGKVQHSASGASAAEARGINHEAGGEDAEYKPSRRSSRRSAPKRFE